MGDAQRICVSMVWVAGCTRVLPWVMGVVVCFLCGKCFALAGDVCAALQLHDKGAAWLFSTVVMDALLSCQAVPYLDTGPCGIASTELSVEFVGMLPLACRHACITQQTTITRACHSMPYLLQV